MVTRCSLRLPVLDQKTRRTGLEHPSKQSRCMIPEVLQYVEILGFTLSRERDREREKRERDGDGDGDVRLYVQK